MPVILCTLYLCTFIIDQTLEQLSRGLSFVDNLGRSSAVTPTYNLSKTSKIKELIISESPAQCQRHPEKVIDTFLALARV